MPGQVVNNDQQDILNRGLQLYRTVLDYWREVNLQRLRNYEFVVGKQWTKEDYDWLLANRRSADVYNFILPIVLALSGTQKSNRQSLRAYPVGMGDEELAAIITKAMRWSFRQCDKDFQFSRAFMDAVIGRVGWMKSYWSTDWDVEGMWYTDWHDPFRILIDPETQGDFHRTCNYLWDSTWMTGESLINTLAGEDENLSQAMQEQIDILEGRAGQTPKSAVSWRDRLTMAGNLVLSAFNKERELSEMMQTEWSDVRNGLYRVLELHERRFEHRVYLMDTLSGGTTLVPKEHARNTEILRLLKAQHPELMIITRYEPVTYVSTIIPAFASNPVAAVPQDRPYDIQNNRYCYTPVTALDFHPDATESRSIVDALIDPQQSYNKLESTLKDFIIRYVGHGWIYEDGSISPDDLPDWESREVGINRKFVKGHNRPEPDLPPQPPREILVSRSDHRDSMRLISGVPLNAQGENQTSNEPASLFAQRVQQAGIMQSTLLDALRRADATLGKQAVDGLQHFLKRERYLRLVDDVTGQPEHILVNQQTIDGIKNDLSVGRYDVEIDQSSFTMTAKQDGFIQSMMLAKAMPPQLVDWISIVNNSDIPDKRAWIQWIQSRLGAGPGTGNPSVETMAPVLRALAAGQGGGPPVSDMPDGANERVSLAS